MTPPRESRDEESPPSTRPTPASTFNILFVCTGNTCRSPMAEVITRAELERRGWRHVRVASAGVAAHPGSPASRGAVEVAGANALDLTGHRSQPLTPALLDWADLVLGMGPGHLAVLLRTEAAGKSDLLGDFAVGEPGKGPSVSDPFGGTPAEYERAFQDLARLIPPALDRLAPLLQP